MLLKVKVLEEGAITPTKANEGDAGFDLYSLEDNIIYGNSIAVIRTGIAVEIPYGCVGIIEDRSSKAMMGLSILGGIIDSGYRGEVKIILSKIGPFFPLTRIHKGEKIAQLIIFQLAPMLDSIKIVDKLTESQRGEKGFGSSDKVYHDGAKMFTETTKKE